MIHTDYFKGKKITVMGLGLLGRGVGDVEFLARHGADLIVTDLKSQDELRTSLERLKSFKNIMYVLGEHRLEDFRGRDLILKAAGVPLDTPYIQEAEKNNIAVEMSTALFVSLAPVRTVGITGTRGKSTVTHMVYEALENERKDGLRQGKVFLGGNVRGLSTLALLDEVEEGDTVVLELDSWQLQGFRTKGISPEIAVFTTFMPDHMNYYHDNLSVYFRDKAAIYETQKDGGVLVVSEQVHDYIKLFNAPVPQSTEVRVVSKKSYEALPPLTMLGEHNRQNAALAFETLKACGVESERAQRAVAQFKGVPGRLEKIAEKNTRVFYNDTTATTPEAATAALQALSGKEVLIIMGGSDKGLDFSPFLEALRHVRTCLLLPGTGSERIMLESSEDIRNKTIEVPTMKDAVAKAYSLSKEGEVVVLSPGCASFGLFKNEFERGDEFVSAVHAL